MRPCCFPTITVVLVTACLQVALFVVSAEASTHAPTGSNGREWTINTLTPERGNPDASIHSIAERERKRILIADDDDDDDNARSYSDESERTSHDVSDTDETYIHVKVGIVEMNHSRAAAMVIAADSIELLRSHSNIE